MKNFIFLLTFLGCLPFMLFSQNYNMTNTTISTCSGTFYDSGGAGANYGNNQNFTMTFCSSIPGQQIYVMFTSFNTEANFDFLTVYNGSNTASPVIGTYSGTTSPGTVVSTNGCLTFKFTSDFITTKPGWVAQVGCGTPPPPPPAPPTAICQTAQPFCTGSTVNFPAGTNNGNAFSSSYSCLATSPNPAWYYMEIQNPGNLDITMSSTPSLDIDFVMWGPFTSIASMCSTYATTNVIDCSYSTAAVEYANITGATTGQFYLLLITNYSNTSCNISFTQSGGAATTNCNILCNMTNLTATPSACAPANSTYSVSGQVTFQYPPASGTFNISSSCGGTTVNIPSTAALTSPYNYTISNIPANGAACTITASFSADPTCNKTTTVTSPAPCGCAMTASSVVTPVSCIGGSNGTINITTSNAVGTPTYSWVLPAGGTASTSSLTGLTAGIYICYVTDPGTTNCVKMVTVNVGVAPDVTPPIVNGCPSNISIAATQGLCGAVVSWTPPTTTDNCGAVITQTQGLPSGSSFPIGTSTITYTAHDSAANTASCTFTITVIDAQPPVIQNCYQNIITSNDAGVCGAVINWITPTVTDNCPNPTIVQTQGLSSGALFPIGTTNITYIATDAAGLKDTCTFSITINDTEYPVISNCGGNIVMGASPTACGAIVNWTNITATDNCPGLIFTQIAGLADGSFFPIGTDTITYVATDAYGQSDTCSFTVQVIDNVAPIIQNCPANILVNNSPNICGAIVSWANLSVTDNCGAVLLQTAGLVNGDTFPLGTTNVVYIAHDSAGNADTCAFSITVNDVQSPTIIDCPSNITVNNTTGLCGAIVSWTTPTITDNCSFTLINTANPNDTFPVGLTFVNYTATDPSGNTTVCNFSVTVNDTESPIISGCPSDTTISANANCQGIYSWVIPTVADNCPNPTLTSNLPSGAPLPIGTNTIHYFATDAAGNQDSCSFTVTVIDNTAPIFISCPTNITLNANANCQAVGSWTLPVATDNCPNVILSSTSDIGDIFYVGTTPVTYTATDGAGNTATCNFSVTVIDNTPPVINNCPANITLNLKTHCDTTVIWNIPTVSDNCPNPTMSPNINSGSTFQIGTTNVIYNASDAAGNTASCSFTVTVIAPPAISTNTNVLQNVSCFGLKDGSANITISGGSGAYTYTWNTVPPQYTTTINNLAVGNYNVVVKDALAPACVASVSNQVTITEPATLAIVLTPSNPSCKGYTNGNIAANVLGGTAPYAYSWNTNPAQIGTTATNLGAGSYTLYITDANGCKMQKSVNLTQPSALNSNVNVQHIKCFGKNTGTANAGVTGGTPPYNYQWMANASTINIATNYNAGTYGITITDAQGCVVNKSFTISQPATPVNISTTQIDASCYGYNDGSAVAIVGGGVPPYTVSWNTNPIQTGLNVANLKAGNLAVSVIDSNHCKQTTTIQILQPSRVVTTLSYMNEAHCNFANGSALVIANGGFSPYTYTWQTTPPQYGENLVNVAEGDYQVLTHDKNACMDSLKVHVTNVPPPVANFISQPDNTTEILLSQANFNFINQSVGATAYLWDFGDGNTSIDKNPRYTFQDTGTYVVHLTAYNSYGNACPDNDSMIFTIIPDGTIFIPTAFSPNGDGFNDVIKVEGVGFITFEWSIFDRWGKPIFYTRNVHEAWDGTKNGKGVPEGVYTYKVSASLNGGQTLNRAGTITLMR